jgi:hypothetical protein
MLNLKSVNNIEIEEIKNQNFDLAFFASGYESRCTFLLEKMSCDKIKKTIVLGFTEHDKDKIRISNDAFYEKKGFKINKIGAHIELDIFSILKPLFFNFEDEINILIDYTSMSRFWYSSILNFIRTQEKYLINVYLNYSIGSYDKDSLLDYSYSSINSLPSLEGSLSSKNRTLLILAIGFSPYLIKSVIEEIEPNEIIGILPIPNYIKRYEKKSLEIKNNILTKEIDYWINCSIGDLESIFRTYAEITNSNTNNKDIIFLSLGPKVYTVASILVSQRFNQVTCLYLKSVNQNKKNIKATGDLICNKIVYE